MGSAEGEGAAEPLGPRAQPTPQGSGRRGPHKEAHREGRGLLCWGQGEAGGRGGERRGPAGEAEVGPQEVRARDLTPHALAASLLSQGRRGAIRDRMNVLSVRVGGGASGGDASCASSPTPPPTRNYVRGTFI